LSDGRLLHQLLAEDDPLVAPLQALLDDCSRVSDDCTSHHKALMVEVCHCISVSQGYSKP
jgi:hypothetical protein